MQHDTSIELLDQRWLQRQYTRLMDEYVTMLPSEWAEEKRYLAPGTTPQPGLWKKDVAPYAVEILNQFSSRSPAREIVIAKGAQTCLTVSVAENMIGYTIAQDPCAMMYVSATKEMVKGRMDLNIDPMIDNSGLRSKITTHTVTKKHAKNTGDTQLKKEFPGGFLLLGSLNAPNSGRTFSVKILLLDEIDAAKSSLGQEGDPIQIFKARTSTYENTRKIAYISTPVLKHTSSIWPLYEKGDQRRFFVPCQKCGTFQYLEWKQLKFKTKDDGTLDRDSVYYRCNKCDAKWKNHDKVFFLKNGVWKPTAESKRHGLISYHVSALYSPVGFKSWENIAEDWIEAQEARRRGDLMPMQVFVNIILGEPWEERGASPKYEILMSRRADSPYFKGALPDEGPLFLTAGVDVHQNRLCVEVVGWGLQDKSWSCDYIEIDGKVDDAETWNKLDKFLSGPFTTASSREIPLLLVAIDCGWRPDIVYPFCSQRPANVIPVKGTRTDVVKGWRTVFRSQKQESHATWRYDLDVTRLKNETYGRLIRGPNEKGQYPQGYCYFPIDYKEQFFRMLTAEEVVEERNRYGKVRRVYKEIAGRSNHALDCRIYAYAALYIYAHNICVDISKRDAIVWSEFWTWAVGRYGVVKGVDSRNRR